MYLDVNRFTWVSITSSALHWTDFIAHLLLCTIYRNWCGTIFYWQLCCTEGAIITFWKEEIQLKYTIFSTRISFPMSPVEAAHFKIWNFIDFHCKTLVRNYWHCRISQKLLKFLQGVEALFEWGIDIQWVEKRECLENVAQFTNLAPCWILPGSGTKWRITEKLEIHFFRILSFNAKNPSCTSK